MTNWKNRIVRQETVPISDIVPNAKNWRKHPIKQQTHVKGSLDHLGWIRSVLVNLRTSKEWEIPQRNKKTIIDGHLRLDLALKNGENKIPVEYVDLSPDEERIALAAIDPLAAMAETDEKMLDDLLSSIDCDVPEITDMLGDIGTLEGLDDDGETESSRGGSYNDEEKPEIEPYKAAYRIEAGCHIDKREKCIELFAGRGALTYWYKRIFKTVITSDKQQFENQMVMSASKFISDILPDHMDFNYIDFDDEGTPARDIQTFFKAIEGKKKDPFILALTDGAGLSLKCLGKFDFKGTYLQGDSTRKCTLDDYHKFPEYVCAFVKIVSENHGFSAKILSAHKKDNGNCMYITSLIQPS